MSPQKTQTRTSQRYGHTRDHGGILHNRNSRSHRWMNRYLRTDNRTPQTACLTNNRNLTAHSSGGRKSETGVPAWSGESPFLGCTLSVLTKRKRAGIPLSLFYEMPSLSRGFHPHDLSTSRRSHLLIPSILWGGDRVTADEC